VLRRLPLRQPSLRRLPRAFDTVPAGRGQVRDYHDRWYRPNNTILALVGDGARAMRSPGCGRPRRLAAADAVPARARAAALAARKLLRSTRPTRRRRRSASATSP
jgi:hypothetical protein